MDALKKFAGENVEVSDNSSRVTTTGTTAAADTWETLSPVDSCLEVLARTTIAKTFETFSPREELSFLKNSRFLFRNSYALALA